MEAPWASPEDVAPIVQYSGEGEDSDADVYWGATGAPCGTTTATSSTGVTATVI